MPNALQPTPKPQWRCTSWLLLTLAFLPAFATATERPNIIYIMSDDMGYSDIGCYGSEIQTPHLDSLASQGLRFTQFYNMARCCPTRACLLTGLYPHQAGVGHMMSDSGYDGYRGELNRNCVTIAEVLSTAGYRTYMSGKWHVTQAVKPKDAAEQQNWPRQRGFDRFYGTIHGAGSFFDPNSLARDNTLISPYADPEYQPENGFYYTDAIADQAARFVREHRVDQADQPFFMYVSFTAAHWPMHAREEDIAKYRGAYDAGYQAVRAARYQRMVELGVIDASSTKDWSIDADWMETDYLEWDIRNMEVYAAMIDCMDRGVGRIVDALRETEQMDNTLILFFQDNGGCAEGYGRGSGGEPRADAPPLAALSDDYLQPDMQPKQTRDGYPVRTGKGVMAGPADTYIGYGKGWATVSNTPFREYKHWTHEGGISTPLIAHWPSTIDRTGELEHTPCHLIDLMATAVDLSGATYPTTFHDGNAIKPMEGKSLRSAFAGQGIEREAIYWEHEGNRAVRRGDFKLVAKGAQGDWELYNIAQDRSEQHDLAKQHPEMVRELSDMWQAYAQRADVLPLTPYYKDKNAKFKKNKLRFALQPGDTLSRNDGPYVPGRGIAVKAELNEAANGVIVAQGGVTDGWAVYMQDGQLCFATTYAGKRSIVRANGAITGAGTVEAVMSNQGQVVLSWNGQAIGQGSVGGALREQPLDGLQVGFDDAGNVGDYTSPFSYPVEKIDSVLITLEK
jgi:arylsulfatase A-like enzyme